MRRLAVLCAVLLSAVLLAEELPAPAFTADDRAALSNALATVQATCSKAMDEIFDELRAAHPGLQMRKARGGFRKNDYRAFQWIVVTLGDRIYWITMFYNDLDFSSGNFHTQYGRIQFWKDIHREGNPDGHQETTPNDRIQGWWRPRMDHQWRKLPPLFLTSEDYSARRVVSLFEEFMAECGETLP